MNNERPKRSQCYLDFDSWGDYVDVDFCKDATIWYYVTERGNRYMKKLGEDDVWRFAPATQEEWDENA
jgi:hypothetical protein